jgi:3-deoxy-7-phosphoheptulonate synthase
MSRNTRATEQVIPPPKIIKQELPLTSDLIEQISEWRDTIQKILNGQDSRLLMIVGPCSIHEPIAALDYAKKLHKISLICPKIFFVMRAYFEKPRTRKGWSGYMHDPNLDGSNNMRQGVTLSRNLLIQIANIGIPCATETLSLIAPQYIDDIIAFVCIGARTTESQPHRELASGLSVPVGFKNATNGSVGVAINSIHSASEPKVFMGITSEGRVAAIHTQGNPHCCLVLRGGKYPNYDLDSVQTVVNALDIENMNTGIIIDASHGNSGKDWKKQIEVLNYLSINRHPRVRGLMMESFIHNGNQDLKLRPLKYGISVTDSCIGWHFTLDIIRNIHKYI